MHKKHSGVCDLLHAPFPGGGRHPRRLTLALTVMVTLNMIPAAGIGRRRAGLSLDWRQIGMSPGDQRSKTIRPPSSVQLTRPRNSCPMKGVLCP